MLRRGALAIALLGLVTGCMGGRATGHTPQEIKARGYLVIGTSGSAPPYSSVDVHNKLVGYDIDLGNSIGRAIGVPVHWKKVDFRGLFPALGSGELDLVMSAVRILPRLGNVFLFSAPYSSERTVAVVRANDGGVRTMADIRGRTVAVVAASFQDDVARRIGGYSDLLELPGGSDVFLALHTGHASVAIVGMTAAEHYLKHGLDAVRIVTSGAPLAQQGIVIGHGSHLLKLEVDRILAARRADGSYAALYRQHFGMAPPQ